MLYYIRELLHTKKRKDDLCQHLMHALGDHGINFEIQLAGPEFESLQGSSSLPPAIVDELFCNDQLDERSNLQALSSDARAIKASITVDNTLSPAHTLLQIQCPDQKGLFYDIMRTSKDCDIKVQTSA